MTFIIDTIGHVLTIGYLIIEAEHIELIGPKGKTVTATFVGYDFNTGFGILLPDEPLSVIPMKLGQSSEVKEGDHLFVASFGGLDSVQTVRVISRMEFAGYWEYLLENAIFSSPPHPNFGGAALIGRDGCLLGIGSLYTRFSIPNVNGVEVSGLADFYRKVWTLGNAGVDVHLGVLQGTYIRNVIVNSVNRYRFLKPPVKGKMVLRQ